MKQNIIQALNLMQEVFYGIFLPVPTLEFLVQKQAGILLLLPMLLRLESLFITQTEMVRAKFSMNFCHFRTTPKNIVK